MERDDLLREIDQLFGELINHQRGKVYADARKLKANFTR